MEAGLAAAALLVLGGVVALSAVTAAVWVAVLVSFYRYRQERP